MYVCMYMYVCIDIYVRMYVTKYVYTYSISFCFKKHMQQPTYQAYLVAGEFVRHPWLCDRHEPGRRCSRGMSLLGLGASILQVYLNHPKPPKSK